MATKDDRPITFKVANWWGVAFALVFLLYGGVKIVLGFLDRNYDNIEQNLLFVLIGVILIAFVMAYKGLKIWGWYGLIVINGVVVILSALNIEYAESIVLIVLSAGALAALLAPSTKQYLSRGR